MYLLRSISFYLKDFIKSSIFLVPILELHMSIIMIIKKEVLRNH